MTCTLACALDRLYQGINFIAKRSGKAKITRTTLRATWPNPSVSLTSSACSFIARPVFSAARRAASIPAGFRKGSIQPSGRKYANKKARGIRLASEKVNYSCPCFESTTSKVTSQYQNSYLYQHAVPSHYLLVQLCNTARLRQNELSLQWPKQIRKDPAFLTPSSLLQEDNREY